MINDMVKNSLLFHTEPFQHQREVLEKSLTREFYAILWEQGTGKTKLLLDTARNLWKMGKIDGVLIIAPKGMYLNWVRNEIPKHLPEDEWCVEYWRSGMGRSDSKMLDCWIKTPDPKYLEFLVVNVEALSTGSATAACSEFIKRRRILMCVDESTCIKSIKANRTDVAIKMSRHQNVLYRRIMTGTPITHSPLDLYSQSEFLSPKLFGFPSFFQFRHFYAEMEDLHLGRQRVIKKIVGYKNLDQLKETLATFSSRLTKEECLDLPDKLYETRYIELTPEQIRAYNHLKDTAVLELEEQGLVTVSNVLSLIEKLHQIICGHIKVDKDKYVDLPNNRIQEVIDICEETDDKIIIWCAHRRDVELVTAALREKYGLLSAVTYYGKNTEDERQTALQSFCDSNSQVRFWVGTPSTGGKGLTMVESATVIYYSNSTNLEHRLQSEDRNHRIGQLRNVTYIDLVVPDSPDERNLNNLRQKKNIADFVLTNWKEFIEI
jgi:SNF2 family DNA or RNA helicase